MTRTPISTAVLIALKQVLPPQYVPALRRRLVKGDITFKTEEVAFDKIKKGHKLAPLVSPMVGGKPQKQQGGTLTSIKPAYIKPTDNVTSNRLLKRQPGEALNGELSPAARLNAIRADILNEQDAACDRREEWMVCEILKTGAVTLEGEDYAAQQVDFGRSAENNVTLSGDDKWSALNTETSTAPIENVEDWASRCNNVASEIYMGRDAWNWFRKFKCVKDLMDTRRGSSSHGELGALNNAAFKWVASVGEFDIFVYNGAYDDEDGNKQLYFDTNGVLVLNPDIELYMAYGAIQDVEANASGFAEATRWPDNWFTKNPSVEWLQTQSAPIPVLMDADEACYARV
ncbi:major capsid protein [Celerinatantimonas sp. MCCC 1A17872]|uniref:major capsid protein n=1 Tax=Celerinatantimonas sp. MCCC 1A17872 TaxID=3177514 RepID=UPI0038C5CDAC